MTGISAWVLVTVLNTATLVTQLVERQSAQEIRLKLVEDGLAFVHERQSLRIGMFDQMVDRVNDIDKRVQKLEYGHAR